jgi:hypothetical protein
MPSPRKHAQPKIFPPSASLCGENILSVSPRLLKDFKRCGLIAAICRSDFQTLAFQR